MKESAGDELSPCPSDWHRWLGTHKADFDDLVKGFTNKYTEEAHWGSTFWLTGANRFEGGTGFHNSVSADQVAAGARQGDAVCLAPA